VLLLLLAVENLASSIELGLTVHYWKLRSEHFQNLQTNGAAAAIMLVMTTDELVHLSEVRRALAAEKT